MVMFAVSPPDCSDRVTSMDEGMMVKRQHHRHQFSPTGNGQSLDESPRSSQSEQKYVDQIVARSSNVLHSSPAKLVSLESSPAVARGGAKLPGDSPALSRPHSSSYLQNQHHGDGTGTSSQTPYQKQSASREVATLARIVHTQQEMQAALQDLVTRVAQVHKALQAQGMEIEGQGQGQSESLRAKNQRAPGEEAARVDSVSRPSTEGIGLSREWLLISVVLVFQTFLQWYFSH